MKRMSIAGYLTKTLRRDSGVRLDERLNPCLGGRPATPHVKARTQLDHSATIVPRMNENERIKAEKDGLDVLEDIRRYAITGFDSIHPDDFTRMRWFGLYQQKPNEGHFMLRIKVPSGELDLAQLRAIEHVTREHARGITDITTRQNFQFHWLTIDTVPEVLQVLMGVGISTQGACGDIFRNVTGCPVAGIDPSEVFDARPYAAKIHELFLDNHDFSNLPRKYKTSIA